MKIRKLISKWGLPPIRQDRYELNTIFFVTSAVLNLPLIIIVLLMMRSHSLDFGFVYMGWLVASWLISLYVGTLPAYWRKCEGKLIEEHIWIKMLPDAGDWPIPSYFDQVYLKLHSIPRFASFLRSEMATVMQQLERERDGKQEARILHPVWDKRGVYTDAVLAQLEIYWETV